MLTSLPPGLIIMGAGGHARCVADAALSSGMIVSCFLDLVAGHTLLDIPILAEADWIGKLAERDVIVAVGHNANRQEIVTRLDEISPGIKFSAVVHSHAIIAKSARIGTGVVVLAGAIVNPAADIGDHACIYTSAVVEHDNLLGAFVTVGPAATLGGSVTIGTRSFVGIGASVSHGIRIGKDAVIGGGAFVVRNIPDAVTAVGVPAKIIGKRQANSNYLEVRR